MHAHVCVSCVHPSRIGGFEFALAHGTQGQEGAETPSERSDYGEQEENGCATCDQINRTGHPKKRKTSEHAEEPDDPEDQLEEHSASQLPNQASAPVSEERPAIEPPQATPAQPSNQAFATVPDEHLASLAPAHAPEQQPASQFEERPATQVSQEPASSPAHEEQLASQSDERPANQSPQELASQAPPSKQPEEQLADGQESEDQTTADMTHELPAPDEHAGDSQPATEQPGACQSASEQCGVEVDATPNEGGDAAIDDVSGCAAEQPVQQPDCDVEPTRAGDEQREGDVGMIVDPGVQSACADTADVVQHVQDSDDGLEAMWARLFQASGHDSRTLCRHVSADHSVASSMVDDLSDTQQVEDGIDEGMPSAPSEAPRVCICMMTLLHLVTQIIVLGISIVLLPPLG
jgi:hypothetical protein